ncbi:hypothetical protein F5051DRAFT_456078 [Lentinula edodes]|nr:hypothetical protein F5051DRAFT_456078 [Lentinula edodes]
MSSATASGNTASGNTLPAHCTRGSATCRVLHLPLLLTFTTSLTFDVVDSHISYLIITRRMDNRVGGSTHDETVINSTGASILTNAHNVTMIDPHFVAHHGNTTVFQLTSHTSPDEEDFQNIPKISRYDINFIAEISSREGSRLYFGEMNSETSRVRRVMIQTFEGSYSKQLWKDTVEYSRHQFNPHILSIIGVSPMTDLHYIVYDGACRKNTRRLLASLLRNAREEEIIPICLRVVLGIASGLAYISKKRSNNCLGNIINESLEAFSDENGHTVLQLVPGNPQGIFKGDTFIFNSFISKLFSDATHTIYREKLIREEDDLGDEDIQTTSSNPGPSSQHLVNSLDANLTNNSDGIVSRRREIIWMTSNFKELSLSEIVQTYGDLLECHVCSHANTLSGLERSDSIQLSRRSGTRRSAASVLHNCKGYIREEITLTPDAFQNIIVVFEKPTLNEVCVVCGEVVKQLDTHIDQHLQNIDVRQSKDTGWRALSSTESTPSSINQVLGVLSQLDSAVSCSPAISQESEIYIWVDTPLKARAKVGHRAVRMAGTSPQETIYGM